MTTNEVQAWVKSAPDNVKSWLTAINTINFLHEDRNRNFQMQGMYDGAMSEGCKRLCAEHHRVVTDILAVLRDDN